MLDEYDLLVLSLDRRRERTVQCCSGLFSFLAIILAAAIRIDYDGPYYNSKFFLKSASLTLAAAFVLSAFGVVFLTELKIRVGPFAKEILPAVIVVLWTLILLPIVAGIPLATLIDNPINYDRIYGGIMMWGVVSVLVATTILFTFLLHLRHFASAFRKRSRYKRNLKRALANVGIFAREQPLDVVVDRYLKPFDAEND